MFRVFFRWLCSLSNSRKTSDDEEIVATKRMSASSLLLFNRMSRQNVFDGYSAVFTTYEDVDQFLDAYLEQPRPEWISPMLEFLGSQRDLPGESVAPLTGFLCEVIVSCPERVSDWRSVIKKGSQAIQAVFDEACTLNRPKILKIAEHSTALNDLYWGAYRASGSTQYIGKIVDQLEYVDERSDRDLFAAGATAKWSLACHARVVPSVRAYVLETRPSRNARIQELLNEILTIDPSKVQEGIRAIMARQDEGGRWDAYEPPTQASGSSAATPHRGVYRYAELPRSCPSCERRFSDTIYRRLYPRRYRSGTIAFFVLLAIGGFVLMLFIKWLALFVIIPLGSWAMTWHKKVRVQCTSCGWAQTFAVSVRG